MPLGRLGGEITQHLRIHEKRKVRVDSKFLSRDLTLKCIQHQLNICNIANGGTMNSARRTLSSNRINQP